MKYLVAFGRASDPSWSVGQISKTISSWRRRRRCEDQLVRASTSMKNWDPTYPLAFSSARDMDWCDHLGSFMAIYSRNATLRKGFPDSPTHWIVWLSPGRGCHGLEYNLCSFKLNLNVFSKFDLFLEKSIWKWHKNWFILLKLGKNNQTCSHFLLYLQHLSYWAIKDLFSSIKFDSFKWLQFMGLWKIFRGPTAQI